MKIAVTSTGATLEHYVGTRADPSGYQLIIDSDTLQYIGARNSALDHRGSSSGRLFAHLLLQQCVQAVLVRNCDPHTQNVLGDAGITIFPCSTNLVYKAVEQFKQFHCSKVNKRNGRDK